MKIAKPLTRVIDSFQKLPGIGPKTAQRLAYYLLHVPQTELNSFSESVANLKRDTVLCEVCKNVSEKSPCDICDDSSRDKSLILVVEQPLEILSFEKTGKFKGTYHVLHGSINPLENIGPDELYIDDLLSRVKASSSKVSEVIVATNPTMEGEATALYLSRKISEVSPKNGESVRVTRLGVGIPIGAYLEFADETTLIQAIDGRRIIQG